MSETMDIIWRDLPLEIKEKILLKLPYDDVAFITNPSFWRKKMQLDFPDARSYLLDNMTVFVIDDRMLYSFENLRKKLDDRMKL
jgi:hypothetical protein